MPSDTLFKPAVAADELIGALVEDRSQLRSRLAELGPFWNLERHGPDPAAPSGACPSPIFYGDVASGVRIELRLPEVVSGLSPDALLMFRGDGGWEVFGSDGVLAEYGADAVRVSVRRRLDPGTT